MFMVCCASAELCTKDMLLPTRGPIHSSCNSCVNNTQSFTQRLAAALNREVIILSARPFFWSYPRGNEWAQCYFGRLLYFIWPPLCWIIIQGWACHAKLSKLYTSVTQNSLVSRPSSVGNLLLLQTKAATTEKWNMLFY